MQTVSALVSWSHDIAILEKVKGAEEFVWYINRTSEYRVTSSLPAELEVQLPSVVSQSDFDKLIAVTQTSQSK